MPNNDLKSKTDIDIMVYSTYLLLITENYNVISIPGFILISINNLFIPYYKEDDDNFKYLMNYIKDNNKLMYKEFINFYKKTHQRNNDVYIKKYIDEYNKKNNKTNNNINNNTNNNTNTYNEKNNFYIENKKKNNVLNNKIQNNNTNIDMNYIKNKKLYNNDLIENFTYLLALTKNYSICAIPDFYLVSDNYLSIPINEEIYNNYNKKINYIMNYIKNKDTKIFNELNDYVENFEKIKI
jgi:hypothetical protein